MKIKALKGTRDYLPQQAALREYMEQTILACYRENGFQRIMTPAIEDIENLAIVLHLLYTPDYTTLVFVCRTNLS